MTDVSNFHEICMHSFPWVESFNVIPDRFDEEQALLILATIDEVLGAHVSAISFLRIATIQQELKTYIDFDETIPVHSQLSRALYDSIRDTQEQYTEMLSCNVFYIHNEGGQYSIRHLSYPSISFSSIFSCETDAHQWRTKNIDSLMEALGIFINWDSSGIQPDISFSLVHNSRIHFKYMHQCLSESNFNDLTAVILLRVFLYVDSPSFCIHIFPNKSKILLKLYQVLFDAAHSGNAERILLLDGTPLHESFQDFEQMSFDLVQSHHSKPHIISHKTPSIWRGERPLADSNMPTESIQPTMPELSTLSKPHVAIFNPQKLFSALKELSSSGDRDTHNRVEGLTRKIELHEQTLFEEKYGDAHSETSSEAFGKRDFALTNSIKNNDSIIAAGPQNPFPNFEELFSFIRAQVALSTLANDVFQLPPILLIGEPGIGKTEVLMRLSQEVQTGFLVQNVAAMQTGTALSGSDAHWSNSRHGSLFDLLVFGKTANPIIFLDEIDKATGSHPILGSLYGLLERTTASQFQDLSLPNSAIDASHVVWFSAANVMHHIDPAILQRFKVFHIPAPSPEQMPVVIQSVYRSLLNHEKWGNAFSPILTTEILESLQHMAPRDIRKTLESACAKAALDHRTAIRISDINKIVDNKKPAMGFSSNS